MNAIILTAFIIILFAFVISGLPLIAALAVGYILFAINAALKGFSLKNIADMSLDGIKTVKNILITFMLIGIMTALWRACGTIPVIVSLASMIISPEIFVMLTFLLCCAISFLTGTAFGTSATMGVICMTMAKSLGIDPIIMGGAILGGSYFGDRCSPVSTSALLVSELTKTDIYRNIKQMLKTAVVPFVISCIIYLVFGFLNPPASMEMLDVSAMFSSEFSLSLIAVLPAVLILILAFFKVNVKINMLASSVFATIIAVFIQNLPISDILTFSVVGFTAKNEALAPMINGGGIVSMLNAAAIVCISSSYSGIFKETGLLEPVRKLIDRGRSRLSAFALTLASSLLCASVACNQTLTIMLTNELCSHTEENKNKFAIYLENSAVVVAPLIPWSIASGVSLSSVGAPSASIVFALFLYLLPIYSLFIFRNKHK